MSGLNVLFAGFGGQGILFTGKVMAYAALMEGKELSWLPSYGPEMRGGTANCSVVVSDAPVASPIIATPDCLIAMNQPSLDKFVDSVKSGGIIIVNSSLISEKVERKDVRIAYVDANNIALQAGNVRTANIVILGAYIKLSGLLPYETVYSTIDKLFEKKPKVIPVNKKAFELGYSIEI